jgi:hypothetical protein
MKLLSWKSWIDLIMAVYQSWNFSASLAHHGLGMYSMDIVRALI